MCISTTQNLPKERIGMQASSQFHHQHSVELAFIQHFQDMETPQQSWAVIRKSLNRKMLSKLKTLHEDKRKNAKGMWGLRNLLYFNKRWESNSYGIIHIDFVSPKKVSMAIPFVAFTWTAATQQYNVSSYILLTFAYFSKQHKEISFLSFLCKKRPMF